MTCRECEGAGWFLIQVQELGYEYNQVRTCSCEAGQHRRLKDRNHPLHLAKLPISKDRNQAPVAKALKRSINLDKGVLVYGPTGTGKSYLLNCLVGELCAIGRPTYLVQWNSVLYDSMKHISRDEDTDQVVQTMIQAQTLVIDDIGFGGSDNKTFVDRIWGQVIDTRCKEQRKTYGSTNLQGKDLRHAVGPRIYSRLHELMDLAELGGPDRRMLGTRKCNAGMKQPREAIGA